MNSTNFLIYVCNEFQKEVSFFDAMEDVFNLDLGLEPTKFGYATKDKKLNYFRVYR